MQPLSPPFEVVLALARSRLGLQSLSGVFDHSTKPWAGAVSTIAQKRRSPAPTPRAAGAAAGWNELLAAALTALCLEASSWPALSDGCGQTFCRPAWMAAGGAVWPPLGSDAPVRPVAWPQRGAGTGRSVHWMLNDRPHAPLRIELRPLSGEVEAQRARRKPAAESGKSMEFNEAPKPAASENFPGATHRSVLKYCFCQRKIRSPDLRVLALRAQLGKLPVSCADTALSGSPYRHQGLQDRLPSW